MSATDSERTRAAASSIASGMPSSRAPDLGTAGASRSVSENAGLLQPRALHEQLHRVDRASASRLGAAFGHGSGSTG